MIRRAEIKDVNRIAEIHVFGWRCAYREILSDEYLLGKASVGARISAFTKSINENIEETYVFDDNEIIKAFMTIGKSRNEDKKEAFELWGIYVEPLLKGTGIGTKMIQFWEDIALERGFKENILWVFKDNIKSRKFYEKMGYKPDGKEELIEKFNAIEMRYCKNIGTNNFR